MFDFKEDIRQHFKVNLTKEQVDAFELYYSFLIEYNSHTNLTAITDRKEVYYKHFYDSLTLIDFIEDFNSSICDMGSGAGFPSIPLKIINNNLKVTIVDSSLKRIKFLQQLVEKLNLKEVNLVHSRIEDYGLKNQEKFDYVTARALGNAILITELAIPMLKEKGIFLMMKGDKGFEELKMAQNAFKVLNSKVINMAELALPYEYGSRTIYKIEKIKHVKGYPRKYKEMINKPL